MEVKVLIDKDTINANVETSLNAPYILIKGKPFSDAHKGMYMDFLKKVIPIIKDNRNVELKKTVSSKGEAITWVNIISNSNTSEIFNIFKSMGMYIPRLSVGINTTSNTMYVASKLCKDLSRYSDTQKAAVSMYMLALVHFVVRSEELLVQYEYDGTSNTVKIIANNEHFKECLREFTNDEVWYIKDFNDDEYSSVSFYNTSYVNVNDQYANGDAVKIGITKHINGGIVGLATTKLGTASYTFVLSENVIFTNFDLCNMEVSSDSICAFIASAYKKNITLKKVKDLPLSNEMSFVDFEYDGGEGFDDFVKTEKIPRWLAKWLVNMMAKGTSTATAENLSHLTKTYGIKVPVDSSIPATLTKEEMCKLYEKDSYAQELYKQIKPYYEKYNLGVDLDANLKGFSNGALYAMAFIGESGTGKSTAARVIPARCGIPYISVNFSVNIEEADLFGSMVPNPKKLNPEDPEFVWADGIITKAVRYGYCVILEELNFARPGVLGKLNSLLDENRQVDLSTGEIVRAHPNFRIIATCNIAYEGTNRFNKALINRFDDVTVFKDLSRNDAVSVIKSRTGYTNVSKISKVYDVYEALKKFAAEQNVNAVVSMRQLLNIFTKGKYYSSAKDAVQRIMINGAFIEDSEYQKVFEETVFTAFDLKFKI